MQWLKAPSLVAVAWGVALLVAIALMTRAAQKDRDRLLKIFAPGLYFTSISVLSISAIHIVLATFLVYWAGVAPDGRPVMITTLAAGSVFLGGIGLLIVLINGLIITLRRAKTEVVGKVVARSSCPRLWRYVEDLAGKLGALAPDRIIVGLTPTFFVTEADVARLGAALRGRTLFLSLPLCRILSEPELRAIIGHELGHFRGEDTKFSQKFYPFYRGATESLHGSRGMALFPAYAILNYFVEGFETQVREIDRSRELAADRAGAEVAGRKSVASALIKVHAFEHYWADTYARMADRVEARGAVGNVSELFADRVAEEASETHFVGLDEERLSHPTDSHPPLGARLEALEVRFADVVEAALSVAPQNRAVELIDDYTSTEQELTNLEINFLVKSGQVVMARAVQCPSCGRANPLDCDACQCGFKFHRFGLG